jgi:hypothetical protein
MASNGSTSRSSKAITDISPIRGANRLCDGYMWRIRVDSVKLSRGRYVNRAAIEVTHEAVILILECKRRKIGDEDVVIGTC